MGAWNIETQELLFYESHQRNIYTQTNVIVLLMIFILCLIFEFITTGKAYQFSLFVSISPYNFNSILFC